MSGERSEGRRKVDHMHADPGAQTRQPWVQIGVGPQAEQLGPSLELIEAQAELGVSFRRGLGLVDTGVQPDTRFASYTAQERF